MKPSPQLIKQLKQEDPKVDIVGYNFSFIFSLEQNSIFLVGCDSYV